MQLICNADIKLFEFLCLQEKQMYLIFRKIENCILRWLKCLSVEKFRLLEKVIAEK